MGHPQHIHHIVLTISFSIEIDYSYFEQQMLSYCDINRL